MILLLAINPFSLARVAGATTTLRAAIAFILALAFHMACFPALIALHISKPFGELHDVVGSIINTLVGTFFVALLASSSVTGIAALLRRLLFGSRPVSAQTRILLLSPATVLLPAAFWALFESLYIVGHYAMPHPWPPKPLLEIASSCWWAPATFAAWFAFLVLGLSKPQFLPPLCRRCGYDCRGLTGPCPECGASAEV